MAGRCASAEVRERDKDTKRPSSRSGFDPGLRSSFFLIETLAITGQKFCLKNGSNCLRKGPLLRRSTPINGIIIITIILRTPGKASLEQNYNINHAAEGQ